MANPSASSRKRRLAAAAAMAVLIGAAAPVRAQDDTSYISLGAGAFDVLHNNTAGEMRGEFRFGQGLWFIKPFIGAEGTTDRSVYAYWGLRTDLFLTPHWVITPNAAVGYYDRGSGKDLGSHIEFRTGAEFAYRFEDLSRLGFTFHHISNAGIGTRNPGEEEMLLMFSLPLNLLK